MPVSGMLAAMSRTSLMAVGAVAFIVLVVVVAALLRSRRGKQAPALDDATFAWGEPHGDFAPLPPGATSAPPVGEVPVVPTLAAAVPEMVAVAPAPAAPPVAAAAQPPPVVAKGRRGRKAPATVMAPPEPVAPAPSQPAAQAYMLKCPACQSQFKVEGVKPIVTNCPGCGKKGYLR